MTAGTRRAGAALAVAAALLGARVAPAEPARPRGEIPKLEVAGPRGSTLRLEVAERYRFELSRWFETDPAGPQPEHDYEFHASKLQLGLRATRAPLEAFVQLQHTWLLDLPEGAPGPGGAYHANSPRRDQSEVFLRNAWLRWQDALGVKGLALQGGRQLYRDGLEAPAEDATLLWLQRNRIAERLVGSFDYTHAGRSFDGAQVAWDAGRWNVTGFAFVPTWGGFETDGNRNIERIRLAGVAASARRLPGLADATARLFWIGYEDERGLVPVDNRPLAARQADRGALRIHAFGGHALHVRRLGPGRLDLLAWGVAQVGDWQGLDHRAFAFALEAGYQLPDVFGAPWLRAGIDFGSGDGDPADGRHESFFQLLPTARLYAQTPFYNAMNDRDVFAQLVWKPHPRVGLRADVRWLRLAEGDDLLYAGGGAASDRVFGFTGVATGGRRSLGVLADLTLALQLTRQLGVQLYFGHVFGGSGLEHAYRDGDADYAFAELSLAF